MSLIDWVKKNPLEAAALGTAIYFTGGAALGGVGAAGATGAATGAAGAGGAVGAGAASGAAAGAPAATGGLLGSYTQPIMQGMQAAQMAQGLLGSGGSQAPMQAPARQGGPLDLSSIFQANQQQSQADAEAQKRREEEMQRYTMMMGGYRG